MVAPRDVNRMLRPVKGQMRGMIRRATLGTLKTDSKLQSIQAKSLKDDVDDGVEVFEQHGFTSGPPAGSEGLVLRVGGERAGSVAIMFSNRTVRLQVEQGEVAMYHEDGARVLLKNDGGVEVEPKAGKTIKLGAGSTLAVAIADEVIDAIDNAWAAATPIANDGGSNLKSTWLTSWNAGKNSIKATKAVVE